jgi:hypothetical protein
LFHAAGNHLEEERALDETMHALRALRKACHCELASQFRIQTA